MHRPLAKITPLYYQVFAKLRDQIVEGVYRKDDALPGEFELARQFGVSRITIRRALEELAGARLVVREQGSGTFVLGPPASQPIRTSLENFLQYNRSITEESKPHLLSFHRVDATPHVAKKLGLETGADVFQLRLVRRRDGPTIYSIGYYPPAIGSVMDPHDVGREPTFVWLERMKVRVTSGDLTVSSIGAGADEAAVLDVAAGTPLTVTERVLFDAQGRALELARMAIRPDRHELSMQFSLGASEGCDNSQTGERGPKTRKQRNS